MRVGVRRGQGCTRGREDPTHHGCPRALDARIGLLVTQPTCQDIRQTDALQPPQRPSREHTAHPGRDRGVIDGYRGMQLEWSVPANIDFSKCDDVDFRSWTGVAGSWGGQRPVSAGPGAGRRLWILDVDGERLVIDGLYMPSADAKESRGALAGHGVDPLRDVATEVACGAPGHPVGESGADIRLGAEASTSWPSNHSPVGFETEPAV